MTLDKRKPKNRVLDEMTEMALALQNHHLISKRDMVKMKLICEAPPEYTPAKVMAIRVGKARVSPSVLASMLNVREPLSGSGMGVTKVRQAPQRCGSQVASAY